MNNVLRNYSLPAFVSRIPAQRARRAQRGHGIAPYAVRDEQITVDDDGTITTRESAIPQMREVLFGCVSRGGEQAAAHPERRRG